MQKYFNIVDLPRPASKRAPMSMRDRAAQFSAFAALSGYEDAVSETARRVSREAETSEEPFEPFADDDFYW